MMNPTIDPPRRITSHGAVMSPRLSRLYTWLDANRVGLNDFSTDGCVLARLPKLQELDRELAQLIDTTNLARLPVEHLTHLQADLRNLMRRIPANRVAATR